MAQRLLALAHSAGYIPRCQTLVTSAGGAAAESSEPLALLVDGESVKWHLLRQLACAVDFCENESLYADFYAAAHVWFSRVAATGLSVSVVVSAYGPTPEKAAVMAQRRLRAGPLLGAVFAHAAKSAGASVFYAKLCDGSVEAALLALWLRSFERTFAVVAGGDALVAHGVPRFVPVDRVRITSTAVHFEVWSGSAMRAKVAPNAQEDDEADALAALAAVLAAASPERAGSDASTALCLADSVPARAALSDAQRTAARIFASELPHRRLAREMFTGAIGLDAAAADAVVAAIAAARTVRTSALDTVEVDDAAFVGSCFMKQIFVTRTCPPDYLVQLVGAGCTREGAGIEPTVWMANAAVKRREACMQRLGLRRDEPLRELDLEGGEIHAYPSTASDVSAAGDGRGDDTAWDSMAWPDRVLEAFMRTLEFCTSRASLKSGVASSTAFAAALRLPGHGGDAGQGARVEWRRPLPEECEFTSMGRVAADEWNEIDGKEIQEALREGARTAERLLAQPEKMWEPQRQIIEWATSRSGAADAEWVLFNSPPGSGKTTSALLLQDVLNRTSRAKGTREGTTLVYCVPTKQVLINVAQQCESMNAIYWIASYAGQGAYNVRRPYSIRTKRGKGSGSTGPMREQLEAARTTGTQMNDRGRGDRSGFPAIIVADIDAVEAILSCWAFGEILLFMDEPNMGLEHEYFRDRLADTLRRAPARTVLASATLTADMMAQFVPRRCASGGVARIRTINAAGRTLSPLAFFHNDELIAVFPPGKEPIEDRGVRMILCDAPMNSAMLDPTITAETRSQIRHECQDLKRRERAYEKLHKAAKRKEDFERANPPPERTRRINGRLIDLGDAEMMGEDVCAMLASGVVYIDSRSTAKSTRALRLKVQRLLATPLGKKPVVKRLYVDLSCIYGVDCKTLTSIAIDEKATVQLSDGDLRQFIGRLRDGGSVYMPTREMAERALRVVEESG